MLFERPRWTLSGFFRNPPHARTLTPLGDGPGNSLPLKRLPLYGTSPNSLSVFLRSSCSSIFHSISLLARNGSNAYEQDRKRNGTLPGTLPERDMQARSKRNARSGRTKRKIISSDSRHPHRVTCKSLFSRKSVNVPFLILLLSCVTSRLLFPFSFFIVTRQYISRIYFCQFFVSFIPFSLIFKLLKRIFLALYILLCVT